jgi:DNA polymerase III alpha subunit (gram-positive type)
MAVYNPIQYLSQIRNPAPTEWSAAPFIKAFATGIDAGQALRRNDLQNQELAVQAAERQRQEEERQRIANIAAQSQGEAGAFGRLMMGVNPQIALPYLQMDEAQFKAAQQAERQRLEDEAEAQKQAAKEQSIVEAQKRFNAAIQSGDINEKMIAENELRVLLGNAPLSATYYQGQEQERQMRQEQQETKQAQWEKEFTAKQESEAWRRAEAELNRAMKSEQFLKKMEQDDKQFAQRQAQMVKQAEQRKEKEKTEPSFKTLGGDDANKVAGLGDVLDLIEQFREMEDQYGSLGMAKQWATPNSKYNNMMAASVELFGRVQSGGAIQGTEIETFGNLLKWSPTGESYQEKLDRFKKIIENKRNSIMTKGKSEFERTQGQPRGTTEGSF